MTEWEIMRKACWEKPDFADCEACPYAGDELPSIRNMHHCKLRKPGEPE
jgi:hypothetical protein